MSLSQNWVISLMNVVMIKLFSIGENRMINLWKPKNMELLITCS